MLISANHRKAALWCLLSAIIVAGLLSSALAAKPSGVSTVKQVGAFLDWDNALARSEEINKAGKHAYIMEKQIKGKNYFIVLEGSRQLESKDTPPSYKDLGYVQVGAFLDRSRAEDLIKSQMNRGAVTFHCMKKINGKVYYRVYRKTGEVLVSPCTTVPGDMPPPPPEAVVVTPSPVEEQAVSNAPAAAGTPGGPGASEAAPVSNALSAGEQAAMDNSPSSMVPVPDEPAETAEGAAMANAAEDGLMAQEAYGDASMANAAEDGLAEDMSMANAPDAAMENAPEVALTNTPEVGDSASVPMSADGQTEAGREMQALLTDPTPITRLQERPPLYEAPEIVVLDTSMVRRMDDNINFAIKPDAVVFSDRNQFGTWYGTFKQFTGGKVVGQSNKWFALELISGKRGYVLKADTVEYNVPHPSDY